MARVGSLSCVLVGATLFVGFLLVVTYFNLHIITHMAGSIPNTGGFQSLYMRRFAKDKDGGCQCECPHSQPHPHPPETRVLDPNRNSNRNPDPNPDPNPSISMHSESISISASGGRIDSHSHSCPGVVWNASHGVLSYVPHLMYTYWVNYTEPTGQAFVHISLLPHCQAHLQAHNHSTGRSEWLVCDAGDALTCAAQLDPSVDWSSSLSTYEFSQQQDGVETFRMLLYNPGWHHVSVRLLVWNMSADVAQLDVPQHQIRAENDNPATTTFTGFQGQKVFNYIAYRHPSGTSSGSASVDEAGAQADVGASLVWSVHLSTAAPVAPSPHLCGGRHWMYGRWTWHAGSGRRVFSPYDCMLLRVLDDTGMDVEFVTLVTWLRQLGWLMLVGDSNTRYLFGHLCEWFRATRTVSPKHKFQTEYCYGDGWFISYHSWWINYESHISNSPTGNSSFRELTCKQQILSYTLCHNPPPEIAKYHIHKMDGPTLTYFAMGSHAPDLGANHVTRAELARHVRHPHMSNHLFVMSGVPAPNTAAIPTKFGYQYQYRNLIRTEAVNGLLYQELMSAHRQDAYRNGTGGGGSAGTPWYHAWLPWLDVYALTSADFSSRSFQDAIHVTNDIHHHILLYLRQYTLYAPQFKPWRQLHHITT